MLQETIQAIKEAEEKAQEMIQHAWQEADEIKKASALRVKEIQDEGTHAAKACLQEAHEAAVKAGEEAQKKALEEAKAQSQALKEAAAPSLEKAAAAVKKVLFQ